MQSTQEPKKAKWNLIIDVAKCENCNNCYMTLLDEYVDNDFPKYSKSCPRHGHHWIELDTHERGSGSLMDVAYLFSTCNQCDNPPCMKAAKNNAVYKREDGIVMIDPEKAKGQKELVQACPYGHIWWNEEHELPQKWSWDAHLLDAGWKEPRPISVCATASLKAMLASDDVIAALVKEEQLEVLHPEFGTIPRVWYKNLYRYTHEHIAGCIAEFNNDIEDVVIGAKVVLMQDNKELDSCTSNMFGDFTFDAIEPHSGDYQIRVFHNGKVKEQSLAMHVSVNIGVIHI